MKKKLTLLLLLFPSLLFAAPKIATFNLSTILKESNGSKKDADTFRNGREELLKNPRKIALDEVTSNIQALQNKIRNSVEGSDEHTRLTKEVKEAAVAYEDIRQQWQTFMSEKSKAMTEELIDSTYARNNTILGLAQKIGNSQGYDLVIEMNGKTNSKTPVVLYLRESTDITDLLVKELSKLEPPTEPSE